ncbi:MAG: hypothetical protein NTV63_02600 [Candidatus Woesearchaeota archaeon]|nr:hypothetical protein [Candidatus Woesearchaeota archaeon]
MALFKRKTKGVKENYSYPDISAIEEIEKFMPMEEYGCQSELEEILRGKTLVGYLGPNERLYDVKEADYKTLQRIGVTYEQIAGSLESIIQGVNNSMGQGKPKKSTVLLDKNYSAVEDRALATYEVEVERKEPASCPWSQILPEYSSLSCSYGKQEGRYEPQENYEFTVKNLNLKKSFRFYSISPHLIREHKFFEGKKTKLKLVYTRNPYRIEPEEASEVLGLIKSG